MYGQTQTYKQIQSFGLSTESLSGNLVSRESFPKYSKVESLRISGIKISSEFVFDRTITLLTNPTASSIGGVIVPENDFIYTAPKDGSGMILINYNTGVLRLINITNGNDKYYGCVYANGHVYCVPTSESRVLKVNPIDNRITYFGSLGGGNKWIGGVLANNGSVYCAPFDSTSVLKIDPITDSLNFIGPITGTGKYYGAVLAPNGYIYCMPFNSTSILKINPKDDTFSLIGNLTGTSKWTSGVLDYKGCIYGIPYNSQTVLKIDTNNDTITTFGSVGSGTVKWSNAALGPDGIIYCAPTNSSSILLINPENDTTTTIGSLGVNPLCSGAVMTPSGYMYFTVAGTSRQIIRIGNGSTNNFNYDMYYCKYFNKL